MNPHPLAPLLVPASIAVVGASEDAASVGAALIRNLRGTFSGPVYAVNPRRAARPHCRSVTELPQAVDLAVIATRAESIPQIIEDCGARGVRAAAILSSGLTDTTPAGAKLLEAVEATARRYRIRVLGPNSLGVMRPQIGLNATFASNNATAGSVALVAQSGALVSAVLDWAESDEVGFSSVVSLGNKLDVDFADVLDFLTLDPVTESIVLYVEGIRNARKFMSALRAAARTKPVIVLKSGREEAGLRAAASHTRSLAGRDDVADAALRRAGAVRVRTFIQLFSAAKCLSSRYRPIGNRLAIVTNGGGPGVMAADWANEIGIEVPPLSAGTIVRLDRVLPAAWSRDNPVDLLEDADVNRYREAVAACMDDPKADGLLVILTPQAMTEPEETANAVIQLTESSSKHLFACWMGDRQVDAARRLLADARIPVFRTPEPAVEAFSNVASYYRNQKLLMQVPGPLAHREAPDVTGARTLIERALREGRDVLNERESKEVLAAFRVPVAAASLVRCASEAVLVAQRIGFPVAMKISSAEIPHKLVAGGVRLNLGDAAAVHAAYGEILAAAAANVPGARIEGVTVQPMVGKPGAIELLLGIFRDPLFGPVIVFGAGGAQVELIRDRAVSLPPLNAFLVKELVERTRIASLLRARGDAACRAVESVLLRVSELACELPWLRDLDINPLIVDGDGAIAADALISIEPAEVRDPGQRYVHMAIHPYPTHLTARWIMDGGTEVIVRPIRPEDAQMERAFVESLSEESRYLRFISAMRELPERMLVRLTQIDYDREMALVAIAREGGRETQIGVARYAINPDGESCEFAVAVADAWQGRRVGSRLMRALFDAAREKGLKRMEGYVLQHNSRMLRLMASLGFDTRTSAEDPTLKHVVKRIQAA
jgi:acetyltransferase